MEPHRSDRASPGKRAHFGRRAKAPAGLRILIAESDRVLGDLYRAALTADGWEVEVVHVGQDALTRLLASPPDALLLGALPDADAVSFVERLRRRRALHDLAVIVLVDTLSHIDLRRIEELGVLARLVKSRTTRETLSETMAQLLRNHVQAKTVATIR